MNRIFVTAMLSIVAAGSALAADLPQPAPPPPQAPAMYVPTVAPAYNWGGIYLGLNGGYGFGNSDWTGGVVSSGSFSTSGFVVGGTLGFNYQWSALVLGAETDLDFTDISGNGPGSFCQNCQTSNDWLGTTRARIGFAADRVLFYGTAGAAYGDVKASAFNTSNSSTEVGWTAGAGVEAAFADNWTARIEYLYVDLSSGSCASACGAPASATQSVSFTQSLIRGGVDYKFNF
jgi:outer membrane immunogenic protein